MEMKPNSFDDRNMPKNNLSKEREMEIDLKMEKLLPEAIKKLRQLSVSQQIKHLRKSQGLLQKDLADKAGLNRMSINGIERGEVSPKVVTLEKIADALGAKLVIEFRKQQ